MRKINGRWKQGLRGQLKRGLVSCFLWWGIGAAIGLLFAISLDGGMQQRLAEHLRLGVSYVTAAQPAPIIYCLRRCLAYAQLLLLVWVLSYFSFGYIGVRILLLARGFLYGFGQLAWIAAYGLSGLWLGIVAYAPHNILLIAAVTWLEWTLQETAKRPGGWRPKQLGLVAAALVPVLAAVEAYVSPAIMQYFL